MKNSMGIAGLILAVIGLVFSWVPLLCWILWILGFIFSTIGVFKPNKATAIIGLVLSIINFVWLIIQLGAIAAAISA